MSFMSITEMTDTEQLHQDFLRDFKELLQRYNARFEVEDMGDGYNSHRVPCIGFNSEYYIVNGNLVRDYSTIELPDYINPN
jgi:hypothetical protein